MRKHKPVDGDASPIIVNDSSSTGDRGVGIRISHPNLLHGNTFKVFEPNTVVVSVAAADGSKTINLVAPWIIVLNRVPAGPLITLSSPDNQTVSIHLDEVDFDITTFDHTESGVQHHHPALTSDSYSLASVSVLNNLTPGQSVENQIVVSGGGALINLAKSPKKR